MIGTETGVSVVKIKDLIFYVIHIQLHNNNRLTKVRKRQKSGVDGTKAPAF